MGGKMGAVFSGTGFARKHMKCRLPARDESPEITEAELRKMKAEEVRLPQ
jgi:hypothetical protein